MRIRAINSFPYFQQKTIFSHTTPLNKNHTKNNTLSKNSQIYYKPQIFFGYKSVLKTEWLKGNMPSVKKGIYGGVLTKDNITLEHILPHSRGGKTTLSNLALAVNVNNFHRSNRPLKEHINEEAFKEYIKQFEKIDLPNFNGLAYTNKLIKVVKKILKEEGADFSKLNFFS